MERDPSIMADGLRRRGVKLVPGLINVESSQFPDFLPATASNNIVALLKAFNGFLEPDHASQISIWPLEKMINRNSTIESNNNFIIGDMLMEADYFGIKADDKKEEIWIIGEQRLVASDIIEFTYLIMTGRFDFI